MVLVVSLLAVTLTMGGTTAEERAQLSTDAAAVPLSLLSLWAASVSCGGC